MRKFAWIAILVLVVAIILVFSPMVTGNYFERKYQQILGFYHNNKQVDITLIQYKRGWFHSQAILSVKLLELSSSDEIPKEYVIDQYIQHGPIIYYYTGSIPSIFGLGAIHNSVRITPEIKKLFAKYHLNSNFAEINDDLITFNGNCYKHIKLGALYAIYPESDVHIQIDGMEGELWLSPVEERISGSLKLQKLSIADNQASIMIPNVELQFDQHEDMQRFWLGNNTLVIPEITWQEIGKTAIKINGINFNGFADENAGLLNGSRQFDVTKIHIDDTQIGPFHLQLSVNKLNAQAILDMIEAYQEISQRGELYQSQLQQKLYMMLPNVINQGSTIKLDGFDLTTPEGVLQMNGKLAWNMNTASIPDNVAELIQSANAQINLRVSKALIDRWIEIVSHLPFFNQTNSALQKAYKDEKNDIYQAMQQNNEIFVGLISQGLITDKDALNLLVLQKQMVSLDEYNQAVRQLLLDKSISLETSHLLSLLYTQVQAPAMKLAKLLEQNRETTQSNMHAQIANMIKAGYIKQENNDYIMTLSQDVGGVKINQKLISAPTP